MKNILKYTAIIGAVGVMAVAAATPSQARWRSGAAVAGGFVAGAVAGAAIANANNGYYGPSYGYYDPGYAYGPAYGPAYGYDYGYAYEPAPTYSYGWRGGSRSATGGQFSNHDYNTSASSSQ